MDNEEWGTIKTSCQLEWAAPLKGDGGSGEGADLETINNKEGLEPRDDVLAY